MKMIFLFILTLQGVVMSIGEERLLMCLRVLLNKKCPFQQRRMRLHCKKERGGYYTTCYNDIHFANIAKFSIKPTAVPREALRFICSIAPYKLESYISSFPVRVPCKVHPTRLNESPFFQRRGEVEVFLSFFTCGLMFPIDLDLVMLLMFYGLPLCKYTLTSTGCMVSFLSYSSSENTISLVLFRVLFKI